uniref:Cellulose binding protein n=1 Tax=Globodera rostochiensis TaxID=31243 RepID=A0A914H7W5_GLORO
MGLLLFFALVGQLSVVLPQTLPPNAHDPVIVYVDLANRTESCSNYKLEFFNNLFMLICQVTFKVQLPDGAILEKYWNMNPVSGTDNKQFTLPDNVRLYPGQSFADAGITVAGGGQPNVTVVSVEKVPSGQKCPK